MGPITQFWTSDSPNTFGFLLFRAMQACALNVSRVAPCSDRTIQTPAQLIEAAFVALGQTLPEAALRSSVEQEAAIQASISGVQPNTDKHLAFLLSHQLANNKLSATHEQVVSLQAVIADREHTIKVITGSRWWRWGGPVRWLMRRIQKR
jgi:hypothetical protein